MIAVTLIWIVLLALLLAVVLGVAAMAVVPPTVSAIERHRIRRELLEASWRIHQQATAAFGQMLAAAREAQSEEVNQ